MGKTEKKVNKRLIGAIIGSALIGIGGLSMTPKGKSFWKRLLKKAKHGYKFFETGLREFKNTLHKNS